MNTLYVSVSRLPYFHLGKLTFKIITTEYTWLIEISISCDYSTSRIVIVFLRISTTREYSKMFFSNSNKINRNYSRIVSYRENTNICTG